MKSHRLTETFNHCAAGSRCALICFITAGDPKAAITEAVLNELPKAGADIIEVGLPFTDPVADGPIIQASYKRALANGQTVSSTYELIKKFRERDQQTPIVLMGYFNTVFARGIEQFVRDAKHAGVDGLIVVDLPPEEAEELCEQAEGAGIDTIFLTAPTSSDERLTKILPRSRGFVYHVSVAGVTGTKEPTYARVRADVERVRQRTNLPIAVGFGVKTAEQARDIGRFADAVVVGSVIVATIAKGTASGLSKNDIVRTTSELVKGIKKGLMTAREQETI